MLERILAGCAATFLATCGTGCGVTAKQPTENEYPRVLPIWIVEDDPNQTIFTRKDLERDRKVAKMLVIPLFRYFQHDGATEFLAIAHPFVYEQGKDIEKHLSSFEQRKNLRRLIFWVPGFFPDGLGRVPDWTPIINNTRVIVKQLQACVGSEEDKINSAMKTLLLGGDFVVGKKIILKVPPVRHTAKPTRPTGELRTANEPYNADLVVRTMEYNGRFYDDGGVRNIHVLWGFSPGTKIVNRLSDEEKKTVAAFFAAVTKKSAQRSSTGDRSQKDDTSKPQH
jgi:hypothetical protein